MDLTLGTQQIAFSLNKPIQRQTHCGWLLLFHISQIQFRMSQLREGIRNLGICICCLNVIKYMVAFVMFQLWFTSQARAVIFRWRWFLLSFASIHVYHVLWEEKYVSLKV